MGAERVKDYIFIDKVKASCHTDDKKSKKSFCYYSKAHHMNDDAFIGG